MKYFLLCLLFFSLSCSKQDTADNGLRKVTLQLNWFPEAEHGGYYEAVEKGYFKELGLDVEILPGGPGVRVETETALGRVDFGIANADKILTVRDNGLDVLALMSPFENSPRCLMVHEDSSISGFDDLADAKLLILNNTKPFYAWLTYKYPALKNVDAIPYNKATFMTNKSAAMQGYINSEPLIMADKGIAVKVLKLSDTGFNPYTSVLICRGELAEKDSDLIEKMCQASKKGWLSYLNNPVATNAIIEKVNPSNAGTLNKSTEVLKTLMKPESADFGKMDRKRWVELAIQLKKIGIIKKSPGDLKKVVY
jgi:NitT/TauT family transport system substrate-binding protein